MCASNHNLRQARRNKKYQGKFVGTPNAEMFELKGETQRNWKKEEIEGYKIGSVDSHRAPMVDCKFI